MKPSRNAELQTLETELSSNPSNYDAHVQYIKLLRKMGELEKLRQAREAMSELFPLTPSMWQEWAKDEASLTTRSEAVDAIEKLYERGVFDYVSVSLWCDYLNFVQEYDPMVRDRSPTGISKARSLFERALTAAGLHIAQGIKLWEAYRTFEQAIFLTINDSDIQEKEKQNQRIRTLFHRQLSVPLVDMKSTLQAYKAWEVEQGKVLDVESSELDGISSHVATAYQRALEGYNARVHLEEQISRQDISDSEKLQQFLIYLKFEESSGDPAQVQVLYERAITDFPIASDLWLDYTRYLDKTLKPKLLREVYSRATKNCAWVGELWVRYLLCLERGRASEEELAAVIEKSLRCTFSTIDEYLDLFLTRVDGLRRRFSFTGEVGDYSIIRETFQLGPSIRGATPKRFPGTGSEVTPRLEELQIFRLQQESKSTDERENPSKKNAREKRRPGSDLTQEQSPAKRQNNAAQNPKKVHGKDKAHELNLVETNEVEGMNAKVEKENSRNEHMKDTYRKQQMKDSTPGKTKANSKDLRNFFSDVGGVIDIRILQDKFTGKSRGLAYVDFSDDAHLTAAIEKNRQMLLGKRLSIARSNPNKSKKDNSGRDGQLEHVHTADPSSTAGGSVETSKGATQKHRVDNVQIKGKNTFAVPRTVKPLGWTANEPKTEEDETPKSNEEFRKMLFKN
uniref:RRM domain-containing protein n=1 Tax=Fagus sylvatica TaxID=28930 RepID=A0A2N9HBT0_FAGSY